jgi:hypothetical protein
VRLLARAAGIPETAAAIERLKQEAVDRGLSTRRDGDHRAPAADALPEVRSRAARSASGSMAAAARPGGEAVTDFLPEYTREANAIFFFLHHDGGYSLFS